MTRRDAVRKAVLAKLSLGQKIAASIAAVVAPTLLRMALGTTGQELPFVTFYPATLLTAVFVGWRWAALVTLVSAVVVNRVFLARQWFDDPTSSDIVVLAFFALSCALLIAVGDSLRRAIRELDALARKHEVLGREMHHRVQNVLSVMAAIVRMADKGGDVSLFQENLTMRIHALSKANRILHDTSSSRRPIRTLIGQAIAPFGNREAFILRGRDEMLPPEIAHHLVLILHELCTNALKHGALSVPQGKVTILWKVENGSLRLEWQETGGPLVRPPTRKGLGTRLLAAQQTFKAELLFEPTGVRCILTHDCAQPDEDSQPIAASG